MVNSIFQSMSFVWSIWWEAFKARIIIPRMVDLANDYLGEYRVSLLTEN